jgi:hypothetical protein
MLELKGSAEPPLRRYQVVGERSSGTNFVNALFRRNLVLEPTQDFGWKHGFPRLLAVPDDMLLIATFRHPRDWVRSMFVRPWHTRVEMQRLAFSEFLRTPWDTRVDRPDYFGLSPHAPELGQPLLPDRHPLTGAMFANVLRMRSAKAAALLGLFDGSPRMALVGFEAVLADPEGFVARMAATYGLARKGGYRAVTRRLGQRFRAAVESRPAPPDSVSGADLAFIWGELEPAVEARLGYRP